MYALDTPLSTSRHLSWFVHREALYVYHDLFGYILEMSPDIKTILEHFRTPTTGKDAISALSRQFAANILDDHIETFTRHECLVPAHLDERALLAERYPIKAKWHVVVNHNDSPKLEAIVGPSMERQPQRLIWEGFERALWNALDGEHTLRELTETLAKDAQMPVEEALERAIECVASWTHSRTQLTRVSTAPLSFFRGHIARPHHLDSTMPFAPLTDGAVEQPQDIINLTRYHTETIQNADQQFDEVETTLSHLFREPHPALGGDTYAARLVRFLSERGALDQETTQIVEVGGGVGYFAQGFLSALTPPLPHYRIVDLSPELQRSQREKLSAFPNTSFTLGNGESLSSVEEASIDLLISNEVIADMRTARLSHERVGMDNAIFDPDAFDEDAFEEEGSSYSDLEGPDEAIAMLERHAVDLSEAPAEFLVNLGAMCFLETLWRVLKPGGHAVLTEFGDRWRYPVESTHLDHAEVSIHFGQLEQVSRSLGFHVELMDVPTLLGLEHGHSALISTRTWLRNLQHLFAAHQLTLRKLAYTRPQLEALCADSTLSLDAIETLHWRPIEERTMGLEPYDFKALVLLKPQ